jgi:hypothetical protein
MYDLEDAVYLIPSDAPIAIQPPMVVIVISKYRMCELNGRLVWMPGSDPSWPFLRAVLESGKSIPLAL